ncbi:MAG: NAD(P)-binding domain-containing protein [Nocardioides sp.]
MTTHPLVIVGAGPIGLAAAAHAQSRGLPTVVLEAGDTAGAAVRQWGHVRLFSAWGELVDPVAAVLLADRGWVPPAPASYPTGEDWARDYLVPLADALAATAEVEVRFGHRVTALTRQGRDRMVDAGRAETPFELRVATPTGPQRLLASAVIDASGTWGDPSPLGADGLPAYGEAEHADQITYGIPDFTAPETAARFGGRHVAVAGTGASAQNVLVGLTQLAERVPGTRVSWLVRRGETADAFGGGDNDQLEARGALGKAAQAAVSAGPVTPVTRFRAAEVADDPDHPGALRIIAVDGASVAGVDEVVVVTGFRPDLAWMSEVRIDLDPVLSAPARLAPLIDPNVHSCGTVYPHGAAELAQPEPGLYLAGMKSYGRAPSFLALTGFEQTRSIVAAIAGDHEAAARVELTLPETGVCGGSGQFDGDPAEAAVDGGGCCGTAAPDLLTIGARQDA